MKKSKEGKGDMRIKDRRKGGEMRKGNKVEWWGEEN